MPPNQARPAMNEHSQEFLQFCIDASVLRFGEFTLKSGRVSPYFFNAGLFHSGRLLNRLSEYYARTLHDAMPGEIMLYGPAYKGIPLVTAVGMAMDRLYGRDLALAYNRKEAKDHGEGGVLVGAPLSGDVVIVDDVITAGTSVGESVRLIRAAGATPAAVLIALDREEIVEGAGGRSAVQVVSDEHGLPVIPIARLTTLVDLLGRVDPTHLATVEDYRRRYGVDAPAA